MVRSVSRDRIRPGALGALVATSALLLAACAPATEPAEEGAAPDGAINVAVLPTANMAAVYLGQQEGFFEDEGLTLELTTVNGGAEMIAGLQSGSFDFVAVGYVPLFAAAAQGLPVALLAGNDTGGTSEDDDWQVVVAGADSPIQSAADLEGKTIGVNALKGVAEATIRASLREQGVDDTTVDFVEVPFPQVPTAVADGTIDAGFGTEPFVTAVLEGGGRIVDYPSLTLGSAFPNGAWATSKAIADEQPETLEAFHRAISASLEFAQENPDAVRDILPTYTSITPELAAEIRLPLFTSELDREQLGTLADVSLEFGAIPSAVDLDALIVEP
ncbi:ABC transporter substrate-binding protein [Microbacterium rhizophilus]|uniref:ABC transporter substrate-binding protein n=1 Tax=Microbacterium rhizophilus TaxID=3138934 RepID=UPI0031EB2658